MAGRGTIGKTGRTVWVGLAASASLAVVVCGFVIRTAAVEPCEWCSSSSDLKADRIDDLAEEIKEPTWFFPAAPAEVRACVRLPRGGSMRWHRHEPGDSHEILVTPEGNLWLAGAGLAPEALARRLETVGAGDSGSVLVTADERAPWSAVAEALAACSRVASDRGWVVLSSLSASGSKAPSGLVADFADRDLDEGDGRHLRIEVRVGDGGIEIDVRDPEFTPRPVVRPVETLREDLLRIVLRRRVLSARVLADPEVPFGTVFTVGDTARAARIPMVCFGVTMTALPEARMWPSAFVTREEREEILDPGRRRARDGMIVRPAAGEEILNGISLPRSARGEAPTDERDYVEVAVTADRRVFAGGVPVGWTELSTRLSVLAEERRDRIRAWRPSRQAVVIRADADVWWRAVCGVRETCARPEVRIDRIYLAVRCPDRDGVSLLPCFLPTDPRPDLIRFEDTHSFLEVELTRRPEEKTTGVMLLDRRLGDGDAGFGALARRIGEIEVDVPARLNAWPAVPLRDVVRAADALQEAGFDEIEYIGAPPMK